MGERSPSQKSDRLSEGISLSRRDGGFAVDRNANGLNSLCARLAALSPVTIALEATGGFETVAAAALAAAGLPAAIVNPAQIRAFAHALGAKAKTDPIDAAVIARFAEAPRPAIRPLADAETQLLADLIARRRQIVDMIVAETGPAFALGVERLPSGVRRRRAMASASGCAS
jgi:transposase